MFLEVFRHVRTWRVVKRFQKSPNAISALSAAEGPTTTSTTTLPSWGQIMAALSAAHDAAMQMIDTSVVRVHQHGACIAGNRAQQMGRSRGGLSSRIHAVVDGKGLPVQRETAELPRVEWARRRSRSFAPPRCRKGMIARAVLAHLPIFCRLTPRRRGPHPHRKPASGACSPSALSAQRCPAAVLLPGCGAIRRRLVYWVSHATF